MSTQPATIVAIGFSAAAQPLLRRLQGSGLVGEVRWAPDPDPHAPTDGSSLSSCGETQAAGISGDAPGGAATWLAQRWSRIDAVVAVGACGLVTRLIAPLLTDKERDPAVVVVDAEGRFAVPLLGGHASGGERLSREIAALLGGEAILTGGCATAGRLPLDAFGEAWGWIRGRGDWRGLMVADAAPSARLRPALHQEGGTVLWQALAGVRPVTVPAAATPPQSGDEPGGPAGGSPGAASGSPPSLIIGPRNGGGCRWHPPCLWLGVGCERGTSLSLLERLVERTLEAHGLAPEAVAGIASAERKGDEPALLELAERRGWPLRLHPAADLARVPVPHPSAAVAREMGTASVAEAAALLSSARGDAERVDPEQLVVPKTIERAGPGERGAATLAVGLAPEQWAPRRGSLHLVGSGPGGIEFLSGDARRTLTHATVWVGYGPYLDLLEPLRRPDQLRRDGRLTEERERCREALDLACQGLPVALVSSGDSGIYGMAGLALELWLGLPAAERPAFQVHPGLSALQLAAARVGAPLMHDFCTISLSDRLTPWPVIERRLRAAAAGDFVVALYNPRSLGRTWQLGRARDLLLEGRPGSTPVAVARQLGREGEEVSLHTLGTLPLEEVDMLTLVLVGNSTSSVRDGRMVTPRGYPGAALA